MRLLLVLVFLFGCGAERTQRIINDKPNLTFNHDDFQPYIQMFVTEAWSQGIAVDVSDITVGFEYLEPPVAGLCYKEYKHIKIDPKWHTMDTMTRVALMYHELGHCALDREHTNEFSIMQPILLNSFTFLLNEEELFKELFNPELQLAGEHIHSEFCGGIQ